jgi:hypothetical protein
MKRLLIAVALFVYGCDPPVSGPSWHGMEFHADPEVCNDHGCVQRYTFKCDDPLKEMTVTRTPAISMIVVKCVLAQPDAGQ